MKTARGEFLFNLTFWLFYFLYEWLGLAALSGNYAMYFVNACMALPLSLLVSWITVHVLLKRFYKKQQKASFWIFQIGISIALLLLRRLINYYVIYPTWFPFALQVPLFSFGKLIVELVNLYLVVGAYTLFYIVQSWYAEQQRVQELLKEKAVAELELLKAQVQPHFIFNTLNNIYSQAMQTSPDTARLINHLSSFLDYNLYESQKPFVSLPAEIAYIQHYLALQKNRMGERLDAAVNIYDPVTDLSIASTLLLPLVENCFKHGIYPSSQPGWIRVDITRVPEQFTIIIENSINADFATNGGNGGLGLSNKKKRLALIYPNQHELKTVRTKHSYLVHLSIAIKA